ncbi:MAG: DNA adenine methylase [Myxococcota bacterium]|nr:DNA adenine methylase [Myxococcota bacterium]
MANASLRKVHSDTSTQTRAKPFLKWVGGKTQLLPQIFELFPKSFNKYHEPFVGGGAVFFNLEPNKAILSDVNPDLIQAYQMIRDDVDSVIAELKQHRAEEAYYYSVREADVAELSAAEAAARIIFLHKTCFNGLYRVNRRGKFNVPFGKYANPTICNEKNLRAVSAALQGVDIRLQSVFELDSRVRKNDLVYFDPPYVPLSPTASFTSYTKQGFGEHQQRELAELFGRLVSKGAHCFLSNSDTPLVRELYKDFKIKKVYARRAINSRADRRGPVGEVIVCSK